MSPLNYFTRTCLQLREDSCQILQPSVIPCGFIDDSNFTDVDITDFKNDSAPSPMTRCMPTQTSLKISTEIVNPR